MKIFKKLLLMWMIVWLPAAGAAAAMMPLSGALSSAVADDMQAQQASSVMPCHGKSLTGKVPFGQSCSHCVLCHLAGALALPEMPIIATLAPTHLFEAARFAVHPSFIPELTAPPPRPALA